MSMLRKRRWGLDRTPTSYLSLCVCLVLLRLCGGGAAMDGWGGSSKQARLGGGWRLALCVCVGEGDCAGVRGCSLCPYGVDVVEPMSGERQGSA